MSLGHIGQDCFPSKCTGTHSEGALTEPGPPQELGHQARAADGQSRTELCSPDPASPGKWSQWGPVSFYLIQILILIVLTVQGCLGNTKAGQRGEETETKRQGSCPQGTYTLFRNDARNNGHHSHPHGVLNPCICPVVHSHVPSLSHTCLI